MQIPITEWLDMMPHTVTLEPFSDRDDYGKPIYGTAATYRARVVYKTEMIIDQRIGAAELETTSNGHIWFGPPTTNLHSGTPPTVTAEDKVTLPDGSTPNIMRVDRFPDEYGDHHVKVYFQ